MKSKNMFLLLMGVSFSFSTQATEQKDGGSWFKFALPFETWSPLTSGTSYVAQSMLGSAVPSNELTYTAGAGVLALGWMLYRWFYLPARRSWVDLIPDTVRRIFRIDVHDLDVTQQAERTFKTNKFTAETEKERRKVIDRERALK